MPLVRSRLSGEIQGGDVAQRRPSALLRTVLRQAQDRESNRTVSLSNGRWRFYETVKVEK